MDWKPAIAVVTLELAAEVVRCEAEMALQIVVNHREAVSETAKQAEVVAKLQHLMMMLQLFVGKTFRRLKIEVQH